MIYATSYSCHYLHNSCIVTMSFVIGIGVILVGSSCPKEFARELIGNCFVEERTTMLVDVVVDNIIKLFKSTMDWNVVVLFLLIMEE